MDLSKNLKAFLRSFPINRMTGQQKFLAVAAHLAGGKTSCLCLVSDVKNNWTRSILGLSYNPTFYDRAQQEGWMNPLKKGAFSITDDGLQHLYVLLDSGDIIKRSDGGDGLSIFDKKSTHSFDKYLRGVFASATSKVLIADSWVDGTIFDNVLDSIPKNLDIHLIFAHKAGAFDSRVVRFKKEYPRFLVRKYSDLHDRFLVIDGLAYIIGPSIKDAAVNSPALIFSLGRKDSSKLVRFFENLWLRASA